MKNRRENPFRQQKKLPRPQPPVASPSSQVEELLFGQAMAHHQAGRLAEAEAIYRQILRSSPDNAGALHLMGALACQTGQWPAALEWIDRALQINPGFAEAHNNRAGALHALGQYQAAVESYDRAILLKPDYADAWCNRANTLQALRRYQAALESCDQAIRLRPEFADAYNNRGNALLALQQHLSAIESYDRVARLNPCHAQAHYNRGNALHALQQYQQAVESYDKAVQLNPDFADAHNNRRSSVNALSQYKLLKPEYDSTREVETFEFVKREVARLAKLESIAEKQADWSALPLGIRSHPAMCNFRDLNFARAESSGNDLVFYCGRTVEVWNPQTASAKGAGGSEEAVIWLSRLLRQRGWNVTVYANCGAEERDFDGVAWKPDWMWNCRDRQDVTVIWRHPQFAQYEINSEIVIIDLHDVIPESEFTAERLERIHKIFVKSRFHRSLFPEIPEHMFAVIPNGIDAALFAGDAHRDPLALINTSSADRSLEAFLDCFAEIRKRVPNAGAQWAYGWGLWDLLYSSNPDRMRWKQEMQERMRDLGVIELGRISHAEVAALYHRANILAYPSEMAEIDCISLSKAMAAGAIPITTDFAAMGEKAGHGGTFIPSKKTKDDWILPHQFHFEITDPGQKAQFVEEAVKLLLHPPSEEERQPMREWARTTFEWSHIADAWSEIFKSLRSQSKNFSRSLEDLFQQGMAHHQAGRLSEAEALYRQILQATPSHVGALHVMGALACQVGQWTVALEWIDRALQINPALPEAHNNRAGALHALGQYQAAVESYDRAILLNPDYADAYCNRANTLQALRRYQAALESCDRALQLTPELADAHNNRGNALLALGQHAAAIESYEHVIRLNPRHAQAYANHGNAQHALQQHQQAAESYDRAILLKPDFAEAHNNRGCALTALLHHEAALESFEHAIRLNPVFADAHHNRASALLTLKRYTEALESYRTVLLAKPDYDYAPGMRLHVRRVLCDWDGIEDESKRLESAIEGGKRVANPFTTLAISDSLSIQRRVADIYVQDKLSPRPTATVTRRSKRDRIRIGYFSSDYYNHATSYLMAELFELHDRNRFEILGFSFGPTTLDEMRARVSGAMDQFFDVGHMPDRSIAELSRSLEVDIAVDLKGFTRDSRTAIFAERAAPIQVSYLGYPGTMGGDFMDYLIADHVLIPEADRCHYSEKIVYLPDSYQVNDSQRPVAAQQSTRIEQGLPEHAFVYCCFNNAYKISPAVFDLWMRILGRVEGGVLWLLEDNPWSADNLRKEATRRGVAPERLIFATRLPLAEHLGRHRLADLFLDTAPYNAHTTTSDALWTGLPVLTRIGETFAARVAASLLQAVGLPDLIINTELEYEDLAVALAHDRGRYQALRNRLLQQLPTAPLFDTRRFTRHLETAYSTMYDRYHAGLAPDHIEVPRIPT